jgi:hypothetical protein
MSMLQVHKYDICKHVLTERWQGWEGGCEREVVNIREGRAEAE